MLKKNFAINTIYRATEGEGAFIGTPQIFVRFQGCAVGCVNCDSKETWDFNSLPLLTLEQVMARVHELAGNYPHRVRRVSVTGGDPLHPQHQEAVEDLVGGLKKEGFVVNIEASGTRVVDAIFDRVDFISFDVKTPSTQVKISPSLLEKLVRQYPGKYQVKSVISNREDFNFVWQCKERLESKVEQSIPWFLTPCYEPNEKFPAERFAHILRWNEEVGGAFRVVGQQHKWIFGPARKEV